MELANKMKEVDNLENSVMKINNMVIMNEWLQQPLHRLHIWKSPGDISRNHIDLHYDQEKI